jgi:hypothetical protein
MPSVTVSMKMPDLHARFVEWAATHGAIGRGAIGRADLERTSDLDDFRAGFEEAIAFLSAEPESGRMYNVVRALEYELETATASMVLVCFVAALLIVADRVWRQRMEERIDRMLQTAPKEGTAWTNQHPIAGGVPVARVWADPAAVPVSNFWSEEPDK